MSPEDISWIKLWPEWQQKQKLCWCVQFFCLNLIQNKPQILGVPPCWGSLLFILKKWNGMRMILSPKCENLSHKESKIFIWNLLLKDYVMLKYYPLYPKHCWKGSTLPFWRHSFQQTYCVLMRVYKLRYRTQSNCLPPGFYGPISSVNGYYKLLQHMHGIHTPNVILEKPTGFPHYS